MHVCIHVHLHVCVCIQACMYVCMHLCMHRRWADIRNWIPVYYLFRRGNRCTRCVVFSVFGHRFFFAPTARFVINYADVDNCIALPQSANLMYLYVWIHQCLKICDGGVKAELDCRQSVRQLEASITELDIGTMDIEPGVSNGPYGQCRRHSDFISRFPPRHTKAPRIGQPIDIRWMLLQLCMHVCMPVCMHVQRHVCMYA